MNSMLSRREQRLLVKMYSEETNFNEKAKKEKIKAYYEVAIPFSYKIMTEWKIFDKYRIGKAIKNLEKFGLVQISKNSGKVLEKSMANKIEKTGGLLLATQSEYAIKRIPTIKSGAVPRADVQLNFMKREQKLSGEKYDFFRSEKGAILTTEGCFFARILKRGNLTII